MCVPLFFFLGGYGVYVRWSKGQFSVKKSVVALYKSYWKVFLVFVPIAYCFFARTGPDINVLCTRYAVTDKKELAASLLSGFIGYRHTINSEWWFFLCYLLALPLGACFCGAMRRSGGFWRDMLLVVGLDLFFANIYPHLPELPALQALDENVFYSAFKSDGGKYLGSFFAGIVFAKHGAMGALKEMLGKTPFPRAVCVLGCAGVFCAYCLVTKNATLLYTPALAAFLSVFFDRTGWLKRAACFLGRHSTNMWLIHSFYCYYFLEATKLVYCTTNVWVDYLVLTAMTLASSVLLEQFWKYAGKAWSRLAAGRDKTKQPV